MERLSRKVILIQRIVSDDFYTTYDGSYCNGQDKSRKVVQLSISFFIVFQHLIVVQLSFCSSIKGITPNIRMLYFVLINGVPLNLSCVWFSLRQGVDFPYVLIVLDYNYPKRRRHNLTVVIQKTQTWFQDIFC